MCNKSFYITSYSINIIVNVSSSSCNIQATTITTTIARCMDLIMMLGIDAILMHICVDDSGTYVHSTSIDKQYIIWLFRECILTASHIKSQHLHRYFYWLSWLLRGNINLKTSGIPPMIIPTINNHNNIDLLNRNKSTQGILLSSNEFRVNLMSSSITSNINQTKGSGFYSIVDI